MDAASQLVTFMLQHIFEPLQHDAGFVASVDDRQLSSAQPLEVLMARRRHSTSSSSSSLQVADYTANLQGFSTKAVCLDSKQVNILVSVAQGPPLPHSSFGHPA